MLPLFLSKPDISVLLSVCLLLFEYPMKLSKFWQPAQPKSIALTVDQFKHMLSWSGDKGIYDPHK